MAQFRNLFKGFINKELKKCYTMRSNTFKQKINNLLKNTLSSLTLIQYQGQLLKIKPEI